MPPNLKNAISNLPLSTKKTPAKIKNDVVKCKVTFFKKKKTKNASKLERKLNLNMVSHIPKQKPYLARGAM